MNEHDEPSPKGDPPQTWNRKGILFQGLLTTNNRYVYK